MRNYSTLFSLLLLLPSLAYAQAAERLKVGDAAPDITLTDSTGKQFKLSDRTGAGKAVALMFSRAHW